eukprot:5292082-Alexandrium_andersonii.AAC.1
MLLADRHQLLANSPVKSRAQVKEHDPPRLPTLVAGVPPLPQEVGTEGDSGELSTAMLGVSDGPANRDIPPVPDRLQETFGHMVHQDKGP